ncbi:39445_t:CDS:2, partial [Gigaspora margarita]
MPYQSQTSPRVKEPKRDITCFRYREIEHIARYCLLEKKLKKKPEEHQSTNYVGNPNPTLTIVIKKKSPNPTKHVDIESNSSDTFDEFTYEEEILDKIEEYHIKESAAKEIGVRPQTRLKTLQNELAM